MPDPESLDKRVTQLEELLSHQEHLLQQLNEVALELRADHDLMKARFREQIDRLEAVVQGEAAPHDPNEKPPHY